MKGQISAILKKDIRQIFTSRQTMLPMIVVPLVFSVFIPLSIILSMGGGQGQISGKEGSDITTYLALLAGQGDILAQLKSFSSVDMQMTYLFLNYLFMPFFVLIPVMASAIISASCIVGEKEKKTMETLLYAPVPMGRMFWAKVLAAFIPSIVITAIAVTIYGCIVNFGTLHMFGHLIFPTSNWWLFLFLLTPAFSLLATILMVFVSAKAKTYQSAQQWSIIIILPIIGIMMAQTSGALFLTPLMLAVIGGAVLVADIFLVFKGLGRFTRQKLID